MDEQEHSAAQDPVAADPVEPESGAMASNPVEPDTVTANPAGPDPGATHYAGPDPDPYPDPVAAGAAGRDPVAARRAGPDRGGVQAALTSRSAGWVVATLLAGALTGLAVNMATAPSTTVVGQINAIGPGQVHRVAVQPRPLAGIGAQGPCGALVPGPFIVRPGAIGKQVISGQVIAPAPGSTGGPVKRAFIQVPPNTLVPACGFGLGVVGPGALCKVVQVPPTIHFYIRALKPGQHAIPRQLTPKEIHRMIAKVPPGAPVPPGTQVAFPGLGARIFCPA